MIIYIRHGSDVGKADYKLDPRITDLAKPQVRNLALKLIRQYGIPNKIYYSPFRRCKMTVRYFMKEILLYKNKQETHFCFECHKNEQSPVKLYNDNNLSRYFTVEDKKNPQVHPDTLKKNIPIYETDKQYNDRLNSQLRKMQFLSKKSEVIWCITHAHCFKTIAKSLNIPTKSHIEFLQHFVVNNIGNINNVGNAGNRK